MHRLKAFTIVVCLVLAFGEFLPAARADDWNEQLKLTFDQPVEVPGVVLPAGTYWFVLANDPGDRNRMQIFSADWSKLYASVSTEPTVREHAIGKAEVQFAEQPHGAPEALLNVYYPSMNVGHKFLYHHREETELARDTRRDVVVTPS